MAGGMVLEDAGRFQFNQHHGWGHGLRRMQGYSSSTIIMAVGILGGWMTILFNHHQGPGHSLNLDLRPVVFLILHQLGESVFSQKLDFRSGIAITLVVIRCSFINSQRINISCLASLNLSWSKLYNQGFRDISWACQLAPSGVCGSELG